MNMESPLLLVPFHPRILMNNMSRHVVKGLVSKDLPEHCKLLRNSAVNILA